MDPKALLAALGTRENNSIIAAILAASNHHPETALQRFEQCLSLLEEKRATASEKRNAEKRENLQTQAVEEPAPRYDPFGRWK